MTKKKLLGETGRVILPTHTSSHDLAEQFSEYFSSKITKIQNDIPYHSPTIHTERPFEGIPLNEFAPATEDEVLKALSKAPSKTSEMDPLPSWLLKQCAQQVLPLITAIVNKSMTTAHVPHIFKRAIVDECQ